MNPSPDHEQKLERFIHETLRDLPSRRAPGTLEARVMAELERRAALPWWRQSYTQWPLPVRCAFLIGSAGVAKVALMAAVWVMGGFDTVQFTTAFAPQIAWLESGVALVRGLGDFCSVVIRSVPPLWLYGGLAFVGAMYVALFGLSAVAYRTLYASRSL